MEYSRKWPFAAVAVVIFLLNIGFTAAYYPILSNL